MGRKPILSNDENFKTAEDILIYQQLVKQEWANSNPDKLFNYNRKKCLLRCEERSSIPTVKTVRKYKFTKTELQPLFEFLLNKIIYESEKVNLSSPDGSDIEGSEDIA